MRLGIFGGTFNPIHLGHLILAEHAREQYRLDQAWFIPTATPPHKASRGLLSGVHRFAMIRSAIRGHPAFRAVNLELKRGGISYTIDTVRAIRSRDPKGRLFLIVGSDMLGVRWYQMNELCRLCSFVVAKRAATSGLRRIAGMNLHEIDMPHIDISSSRIRARLRAGRSIRYLVPDAVARYLARYHLYRKPAS